MNDRSSVKSILRIGGAFIAWVIGSGFATGQEVLQFFSSFGYWSYGVVAINLVGFITIGYFLMRAGFEHRDDAHFSAFRYFCGRHIGAVYSFLVTGVLLLLMPVLFSGAGAALHEYYGINRFCGAAVMALLVLCAYLIGFERMVKIISSLGPVIIVFSLTVGVITLCRDFGSFSQIPSYEATLRPYRAAPNWALSGILYLSLNFLSGSTYFTQLGRVASSKKELKYGALAGGGALILSITVVSTAILLNSRSAAGLDIPVLFLARSISYLLGVVFSITLVGGIFSSSSAMLWSVCSRFPFRQKQSNRLMAVAVTVAAYLISLLPFGRLIGTFYPLIGYTGIFYILCVLYRGLRRHEPQNMIERCSTK